jgi:hypothetical protein
MNIAYATTFPLQLALGSQRQDELAKNLAAGSASVYLAVATVCAGVSFIWMARVDTFAEQAAQTEFYNSCALAWYFGVGLLLSVGLYEILPRSTVSKEIRGLTLVAGSYLVATAALLCPAINFVSERGGCMSALDAAHIHAYSASIFYDYAVCTLTTVLWILYRLSSVSLLKLAAGGTIGSVCLVLLAFVAPAAALVMLLVNELKVETVKQHHQEQVGGKAG